VAVATAVASIWLTSPEPTIDPPRRLGFVPFALRVVALVWAGAMGTAMCVQWASRSRALPDLLIWLVLGLPVVCAGLGLLQMRRVAARAGEGGLASQLTVVAAAYPTVLCFAYLSDRSRLLYDIAPPLREFARPALAIAGMGCLLWATVLAGRLRQALPIGRGPRHV
jgi:hypothetical protein